MKFSDLNNNRPTAIIIGAGPAGLTAAHELLTRTQIIPIILEQSTEMGGLSRTVNYKGNRLDIGGHRFFSKSERVMNWWLNIMPLEAGTPDDFVIQYQNATNRITPTNAANKGDMMLRPRKSRIYFLRKFFPYPLTLSLKTLLQLGFFRTIHIGASYCRSKIFPVKKVTTLEDFFINRFGRELYRTFFKSYTEKVWGVPCSAIPAEWGVQRIKNLSIRQALWHMVQQVRYKGKNQPKENLSTSLIEQFLYPKLGPGQLWEKVANEIEELGGVVVTGCKVEKINYQNKKINAVETLKNGEKVVFEGDYFFSTMPIKEFIQGMGPVPPPERILGIASTLPYRDFITIGLLVSKFSQAAEAQGPLLDNWIYIQDSGVNIGRLQIFNNWSPFMVAKPGTWWIGLEYFCQTTDAIWKMEDNDLINLGITELVTIGLIEKNFVLDATIIRQEKTYPSYTGSYAQFDEVKEYLQQFVNLYPMGRNGMHRYNNSDHSMLTAMLSVDYLTGELSDKKRIWEVNTEESYHEEKKY